MKLKEALEIHDKQIISLVGGGGKTTLMFALAKELAINGHCVITTTTTKILEPSSAETEKIILNTDEDELLRQLLREIGKYKHITVARSRLESGKLEGISTGTVEKMAKLKSVSHIINEADGAARRPLKAPNATEPVIPDNTTMVIAVTGIDALGERLEDVVFRAEIAAKLLKVTGDTVVSPGLMADLITLPDGITKGSPEKAKIVAFINKTDIKNGLKKARLVAKAILGKKNSRIDTVLLGQAQNPDPVIEIMHKGDL